MEVIGWNRLPQLSSFQGSILWDSAEASRPALSGANLIPLGRRQASTQRLPSPASYVNREDCIPAFWPEVVDNHHVDQHHLRSYAEAVKRSPAVQDIFDASAQKSFQAAHSTRGIFSPPPPKPLTRTLKVLKIYIYINGRWHYSGRSRDGESWKDREISSSWHYDQSSECSAINDAMQSAALFASL